MYNKITDYQYEISINIIIIVCEQQVKNNKHYLKLFNNLQQKNIVILT